ncbi:MAG TPA: alpha/beta fold hydrolase [Solirubrobacteraceae bacterium]|jgi:pimeloyl-ACP methyl ester carboxylesterase
MAGATATAGERLRVEANGLRFAALAWGPADGPLALCLHGYPDTARTWRHLGPYLAERGWRVVAPWTRGYAPTDLAPDGDYSMAALARDAAALHGALAGDERAVLIGHDWGAETAYVLGAHSPRLFGRHVALAVPPDPAIVAALRDPRLAARQLRRSWYMFFQLVPGVSERALRRVIPKLWRDWSPGYDASDDVPEVLASLAGPRNRTAALRYYRETVPRALAQARRPPAVDDSPRPPTLFLYGDRDGCLLPDVSAHATDLLRPPSRVEVVPGAGHFLHLEQPDAVNSLIEEFIGG